MRVPDVMTIKDALMLMRREQVLRLPVVNANGVFQGILSINDVVLDSETGGAIDKEKVQTFLTVVDDITAGYTLLAPSEETPPALLMKRVLALLRESSTNQTKIKSQ